MTWQDHAACRGKPTAWWYPPPGRHDHTARAAIEICNACPVRQACLDDAIRRQEPNGIWGGETGTGRDRIARRNGALARNTTQWQLRPCGHGYGPDNPTLGKGRSGCLTCRRHLDHEVAWRVNNGIAVDDIAAEVGVNPHAVAASARRSGLADQLIENRAASTRRSHTQHIVDALRAHDGDVRAATRATGAIGSTVARVADEHGLRRRPTTVAVCPDCCWADGHSPRCPRQEQAS